MARSMEIQDSEECLKSMEEHWKWMESFIRDLIELDVIEGSQEEPYPEMRMKLIEYGFKQAWPHAWKHGFKQFWDQFDKSKGDSINDE